MRHNELLILSDPRKVVNFKWADLSLSFKAVLKKRQLFQ